MARDYDVDGLHHDYIRYPGDVAPDRYCFCDWCLEDMNKQQNFFKSVNASVRKNDEPAV